MQNRFAFGQSDTSTKGTTSCGILQVHPFAGSHFSMQPYSPACFSKHEYPLTVQHFVAEQSSLLVADQGLLHIGFGFCATIWVKPMRSSCTLGPAAAPPDVLVAAATAAAPAVSASAPAPHARKERVWVRGCSKAVSSSCRQVSLSDMFLYVRLTAKCSRLDK